jgi:hypothetical protein
MLLFLILSSLTFAYPSIEDLMQEEMEEIELITNIRTGGVPLMFESMYVSPNEKFRLMLVKVLNFVGFCGEMEKRNNLTLAIIPGNNRFTNETVPRFVWKVEMDSFEEYFTFKKFMCNVCEYLDYYNDASAVVATETKRTGDASEVLQKFIFDSSMAPCACYN